MSCAWIDKPVNRYIKWPADDLFLPTSTNTIMSSNNVPQKHKAAQILKANGDLTLVDKDTPKPKRNEVLIKVSASSICASDHFTQSGIMGSPFPMSPGHEVVGSVAALGEDVDPEQYPIGHRVGLGWNGGYCTKCLACRQGDFIHCQKGWVTGVTIDGGHQQYVIAQETALVNLPKELKMKDSELAPLMCAGNTVYSALMKGGAQAGDIVVVQALGGLGHLAIQIAAKAGCTVVCISGSPQKKDLALKLGAHHYFTTDDNVEEEMKKIGLAKVAIATAPSGEAPKKLVPLLERYGTLVIVGAPADGKPLQVNTMDLISKYVRIQGLACGAAASNDHFTDWCSKMEIKSMVKEWPLEKAADAVSSTLFDYQQSTNHPSLSVPRHFQRQAHVPQRDHDALSVLKAISNRCCHCHTHESYVCPCRSCSCPPPAPVWVHLHVVYEEGS